MWMPTHAQLTVQRAKGLLVKGKHGTNDCFVVISLGKEKFQTSVKEKSLPNVEWAEECELTIPSQGNKAEIKLTVLHRNFLGVDEFLGQTVIPLSDFDVYERPKSRWHHLHSKPDKKDTKPRGELEVRVAFTVKAASASTADLSRRDSASRRSSLISIPKVTGSLGGSLASLNHKKKKIKKIASAVGHKLAKIPRRPGSFRGSEAGSDVGSDLGWDDASSNADPGVISEGEEDEFGFDDHHSRKVRTPQLGRSFGSRSLVRGAGGEETPLSSLASSVQSGLSDRPVSPPSTDAVIAISTRQSEAPVPSVAVGADADLDKDNDADLSPPGGEFFHLPPFHSHSARSRLDASPAAGAGSVDGVTHQQPTAPSKPVRTHEVSADSAMFSTSSPASASSSTVVPAPVIEAINPLAGGVAGNPFQSSSPPPPVASSNPFQEENEAGRLDPGDNPFEDGVDSSPAADVGGSANPFENDLTPLAVVRSASARTAADGEPARRSLSGSGRTGSARRRGLAPSAPVPLSASTPQHPDPHVEVPPLSSSPADDRAPSVGGSRPSSGTRRDRFDKLLSPLKKTPNLIRSLAGSGGRKDKEAAPAETNGVLDRSRDDSIGSGSTVSLLPLSRAATESGPSSSLPPAGAGDPAAAGTACRLPRETVRKFESASRDDLIEQVVQMRLELKRTREELSRSRAQTSDMEEYLDMLLVRVMETHPDLLQNPLKTASGTKYIGRAF